MRPGLALLLSVATLGCGRTQGRARFESETVAILERHCLAPVCHGVSPDAEARGEVLDRRFFFVEVDGHGKVRDLAAAYANVKARIDTGERAAWSSLVRKPLALAAGGLPHAGGHPFASLDSPALAALLGWIEGERGGGEGQEQLGALEQRFADEVLPVLRDRGCMLARCHGPLGFAGTVFAPPMLGQGGGFSRAEVRASYQAARRNLALGAPTRSRLLVKALPLARGGVVHRGGNDAFFSGPDDPGARAIVAWARAERDAALPTTPEAPTGVVFVRGPAEARALTDLASFQPGSDLWLRPLPDGPARNLTAALHAAPADIRDPAPSHDATRVLFSMRTSEADCHNLYELELASGQLRQLTHDTGVLPGGGKTSNRWPVYAPDGRVVFASTRAGELDESGRALDVELYVLEGGVPLRLTVTPTPELGPSFLAVGEFRGSLAFTVLRRLGGRLQGPVFRFPLDHAPAHAQPEYHPHHGQTTGATLTWALRELPDGRDVAILLDADSAATGAGGDLAVIERQLGPDRVGGAGAGAASVPGFLPAVSRLTSGRFFEPAPLPDGRVVVAWSPAPSPGAPTPDRGLYLATLGNTSAGAATLESLRPLEDAPGLADDQPAILVPRAPEDEAHQAAWTAAASTGTLVHAGAPAIEAILRGLAPVGAKPPRSDITALRLLGWSSATPADTPAVDAAQIANHDAASTWFSNGVHGPTTTLAVLPLEADGSLRATLPARRPFRVQALGADGMAVGAQGARWLYLLGGEVMPQGVALSAYPVACAGCHGALDGDAAHAFAAVPEAALDALSQASVTLASHQGRDPRRPRAAQAALPSGDEPGFDFARELGPILARSCATQGCHLGATPAGGLTLDPVPTAYYDRAYEALQAFGDGSGGGKRYVDERGASARRSYLMEKLLGRELEAPRVLTEACPPPGAAVPALDARELAAFARWIDLGAIYRAPAPRSAREVTP
ncbi:MAG: hypothetical protein IT370_13180 [Deltaproteobacteria bacterium]|nr:hypothetical protein [Deltaproteobacteria bacterium]